MAARYAVNQQTPYQYQAILEAEEITSPQTIKEILDSAARIGFLVLEDGAYRLLPAVHRYLDLFQELAQAERSDPVQTEISRRIRFESGTVWISEARVAQ